MASAARRLRLQHLGFQFAMAADRTASVAGLSVAAADTPVGAGIVPDPGAVADLLNMDILIRPQLLDQPQPAEFGIHQRLDPAPHIMMLRPLGQVGAV